MAQLFMDFLYFPGDRHRLGDAFDLRHRRYDRVVRPSNSADVFFCVLAAQRIRDFGLTGWLVLLIIPLMILDRYIYVATLIAMIIVLVIPGTRGDYRYGLDPLSLQVPPDGPVSHETHRASSQTTWNAPGGELASATTIANARPPAAKRNAVFMHLGQRPTFWSSRRKRREASGMAGPFLINRLWRGRVGGQSAA
ncbi:MAG: DUF805 domain-containing protein [Alphaproteobacteria bacterium]|nr:DUF805 domain-containing protein [Alphaproteobacteria bacterium]